MSFKGKAKVEKKSFVRDLYVGFANVEVSAINPTRAEISKMLGTEKENDERDEILYLDKDTDGNTRLSLKFWLRDEETDKYFIQSIMVSNIDRLSKDGKKVQIVNNTCQTTWVPLKVDESGNVTKEVDEALIPEWFLEFSDDKTKEVLGKKKYRKAVKGEEELVKLLRSWISMQWKDIETDVMLDTKKLFKENLKELKEMVGSELFTKKFVILTGVETNEEDSTKKYQKVFSKAYLPSGFMVYIKAGNKMSTPYTQKEWKKFTDEVSGQYGFNCFHKLKPLEIYSEKEDPVSSNTAKPVAIPQNNEY